MVDPSASLGPAVRIGPYAVVEADVVIGDGCCVGAHAVIKRHTRIGQRNEIHEHAVVGGDPQELAFTPCVSRVAMGDDNVLREGVTIHRGSREGSATRLGNGNYLMAGAHVAHDCTVGSDVVLANGATLGGHVSVGDRVFLSAFVVLHQFCRVGRLAMVSGLAAVNLDVLPFMTVVGHPARGLGLNRVGLKRAGVSSAEIQELKRAYGLLLLSGRRLPEAVAELAGSGSPLVREWVGFIEASRRGFTRHRRWHTSES